MGLDNMTINIPHFKKDIERLTQHLDQGLIEDILVHPDGMIGSVSEFAIQYKPGATDQKGKVLHDELWYRGVRYISTDRPKYFKAIIADINERIVPQQDITNGFLHGLAAQIRDNPSDGFVNSKPWVLANYKRCWGPIVSELEFLTQWKL